MPETAPPETAPPEDALPGDALPEPARKRLSRAERAAVFLMLLSEDEAAGLLRAQVEAAGEARVGFYQVRESDLRGAALAAFSTISAKGLPSRSLRLRRRSTAA